MPTPWLLRGREYRWGKRTFVMGILNATPDSFSGDGLAGRLGEAVRRAWQFVEEGADFLDIGGESSRPGAEPVPLEEEQQRVLPIIERLRAEGYPLPISIDTYHPETAEAALEAGADWVNDITALRDERMARLVARRGVPVVLMHMQGTPRTMQQNPTYRDVVEDIKTFLEERIAFAEAQGIPRSRIVVDPGIGFGKRVEHNLELIRRLEEFRGLGCPILIGPSRKSFIGKVLDLPVEERLEGTAAAVALSIAHGADIVRVHDVKAMVRVARMADAIVRGWEGEG